MIRLVSPVLLFACCLQPAAAMAAEAAKSDQGGGLDEIVIEGVPRIGGHADKPDQVPILDPSKSVLEYLSKQLHIPDFSPQVMVFVPNYLASKLASSLPMTPWPRHLVFPPILDIMIKQPKGVEVARWRVVITDDRGSVFHVLKGKGRLPDRLTWDGRGQSGDMLKVGHPYAYSYHVLDSASVPTYIPGKSVQLNSLVCDRWGRTVISLYTPAVFDKGPRISAEGTALLRESQDALRSAATGSFEVTVYGDDADLGKRQAELVRNNLIRALNMQPNRVRARAVATPKDGYARTEIETR